MAKDLKKQQLKEAGITESSRCKFEDCNKSAEKFGFCLEHYTLYMEGIIRGDGKKPRDYEEKLAQYNWRKLRQVA